MNQAIFDAHVHVWADDREAYPQRKGMERPVSQEGGAEWLLKLMGPSGVSRALLVQTPWYGEDNRYLVDVMRAHPGRFVALGYLPDPLAPDATDRLARQCHVDGFRGIRIHLVEPRIVQGVAEGRASPLILRAKELGVPVQFLNREPEQHEIILELARRFPSVAFINDHLGHPRIGERDPYAASKSFFDCGALPNVFAKVSLHHALSKVAYPWADLHDYQRLTLDAYGAQRIMWGSNFPMAMPEPTYAQRLDAVRTELGFLSDQERAWILGSTAMSLWPE